MKEEEERRGEEESGRRQARVTSVSTSNMHMKRDAGTCKGKASSKPIRPDASGYVFMRR